ncbi:hypothetical protein B0H12DRAFT_1240051 [Mycena haematopus]|nr:hypothetical protein B0H12DRAFT_1240051 [Mycena haematopus]
MSELSDSGGSELPCSPNSKTVYGPNPAKTLEKMSEVATSNTPPDFECGVKGKNPSSTRFFPKIYVIPHFSACTCDAGLPYIMVFTLGTLITYLENVRPQCPLCPRHAAAAVIQEDSAASTSLSLTTDPMSRQGPGIALKVTGTSFLAYPESARRATPPAPRRPLTFAAC